MDDRAPILLAAAMAWFSCSALAGRLAKRKHRGEYEGVVLGLVFGPLGVVVEALLPAKPLVADRFEVRGTKVVWRCACGKTRQADRSLAGRPAPCPRCKAETVVPG